MSSTTRGVAPCSTGLLSCDVQGTMTAALAVP